MPELDAPAFLLDMSGKQNSEKVAGWHAVTAVLNNRPEAVERLCLQKGRDDQRSTALAQLAKQNSVQVSRQSREEMDAQASGLRHQGVLAWVRPQAPGNQNDLDIMLDSLDKPPFLLVLDGVEDPRNLGACLRTADAAGVTAVITPKDRSASLNAGARKTAAGATETVALFQVSNLARCLRSLRDRGIWLVGLAGEAEDSIYAANLKGPLAMVMGAEGKGLRRLSREHCDHLVQIPMQGSVESLNVSVATAVCVYEAVRQRGI